MKREFLQNIKVGDAALPKEVIDLIMEENGRDIEATKGKFSDYDTIKTQLSEAQATIQGFKDQGQDIEAVRAKATEWENKSPPTLKRRRRTSSWPTSRRRSTAGRAGIRTLSSERWARIEWTPCGRVRTAGRTSSLSLTPSKRITPICSVMAPRRLPLTPQGLAARTWGAL